MERMGERWEVEMHTFVSISGWGYWLAFLPCIHLHLHFWHFWHFYRRSDCGLVLA